MFVWFVVEVCIEFVLVCRVSMVACLQLTMQSMMEYGEDKEDGYVHGLILRIEMIVYSWTTVINLHFFELQNYTHVNLLY